MTSKALAIRHRFDGGWVTDFGPTVDVVPDQSGGLTIPYLLDAENLYYELDGGPHKIGGASKVNTSVIDSGSVITGVYDYWRQGVAGVPSRRRVVHAGTKVFADTDDGVFATTLFTGLASGAVPNYSTFDDTLIIASDSTLDVPRSWNQTTAQNLAGTPPRFSFSVTHKGRQFAAGVFANPSKVYYSAAFDPEDWVGAGSGSVSIDIDDGDIVTGIASYKDELIIFKGPNKGSIHRLTGSSPTDFAVIPFVRGLGAAWQNAIFPFQDDLGFVSQHGTVHSLRATAAFGDFNDAALSRPINKWIQQNLNYNRLRYISAVNDPLQGWVMITMSINPNVTNSTILMMDYRKYPSQPVKWAQWPALQAGSMGLFVDTNNIKRVLTGGNDGFVRRTNVVDRAIDSTTSIAYKATTPFMTYGNPMQMKTLAQGALGIAPKGNFNITLGWTRDGNSQQTVTIVQGGGDVLGPASSNQFTLGTSQLAGSQFVDRFTEFGEAGGEFRSVQYQITNNGLNEDVEIHSLTTLIEIGALSTENT
jgi:hypothetical protein